MIPRFAVLLALACAAFSQTVQVGFDPTGREVIERRLNLAPEKKADRPAGVRGLLEEAGCRDAMLEEQVVKGSKQPNIICTLRGASGSVILVGAHYDFTGAGRGVVDNWSGVSLLPSLFEALRKAPRKHTFVFVGFTDEEAGLRGSWFYVKQLSPEQRAGIRAMVNLDSLGLSPTKVWMSGSDQALLNRLAGVAKAINLPLAGVNVERVGGADSQPFRDRKIPAITIHSVTQQTLKILHSRDDNFSAMKMSDYYDTYRLLCGYLVYLDQVLE
ncbi:MAG: M28 family peptidase [Bryobacteraceae bacterium]